MPLVLLLGGCGGRCQWACPGRGVAALVPSSRSSASNQAIKERSLRHDISMMTILDLAELAGRDVEDEATDGTLVWHEGVGLDPGDGLSDIFVEVWKGLGRPCWLDAGVVLD